MLTIVTFGDSVLDCGIYNEHGITPGQLLVKNDDALFPEFQGRDLAALGPARLEHRAEDGATVTSLRDQTANMRVAGPAIALVSIGGNDLLRGLVTDAGPGFLRFQEALEAFIASLTIRPVLLANVYDPTFGDDEQNFLGIAPAVARANYLRMNDILATVADRYGILIDLNAHFLTGDPSWFTRQIEPSLLGASEVRRAFLTPVLAWANGTAVA